MKYILELSLLCGLLFLAFLVGQKDGVQRSFKTIHEYYQPELSQAYINELALKDSIAKLNHKIDDLKHWCK